MESQKTVERFSNLKKEWKEISPMNQKRHNPGVGVVDDKIFVFGRFYGEQCLKTIEVYSEKTKRWEMMKVTMKTERSDMGVAVIGDLVFIIGDWNGRDVVEEIEVMNTKTQTMENIDKNSNRKKRNGSWSG